VIWEPARRVSRAEIRADSRLADLEVFRQPQGSNPSYLTVAQFAALRSLVSAGPAGPEAPTHQTSDARQWVAQRGAVTATARSYAAEGSPPASPGW
jgi:hypothetical protein